MAIADVQFLCGGRYCLVLSSFKNGVKIIAPVVAQNGKIGVIWNETQHVDGKMELVPDFLQPLSAYYLDQARTHFNL